MRTARAFSLSFIVLSIALLLADQNAFPANHVIVTNLATDDVRGAILQGGLVTFACDGVLVLSNQIDIANDVCLDATGHAITLSGSNVTRIFRVQPGTSLCLTNLTLANGRNANGAAIFNDGGTVCAQGCTFENNQAFGTNGISGTNGTDYWGVQTCDTNLVFPGGPGGPATSGESVVGGAVFNSGVLDLDNCLFLNNQALAGDGGTGGVGGRGGTYWWACDHRNPVFKEGGAGGMSGNAGSAKGGSIANFGTLLLNRCIFSNSIAAGGAGGNVGLGGPRVLGGSGVPGYPNTNGATSPATLGGAVQGGAIFSTGNAYISNCFFLANQSVSGAGGSGVFFTNYNEGGGSGTNGGLCQGAAIFADSNSVIANCTLAGNSARGGDGGAAKKSGLSDVGGPAFSGVGGFAYGGAIALGTNNLIVNCTVVSNRVVGGTGGDGNRNFIAPANGGHAYGGGMASLAGLAAANLTIHGNAAVGGGYTTNPPGAYYPPATNGIGFGGSIASTGGVFQIANTILSGGTSNNAWGAITDLGHNLSSDATPVWTSGTSLNNTDPLLLPLANNGGPTLTTALSVGSPALDSGDCAAAPATDQRGVPRPSGPGCDIGAYERAEVFTLQIWRENAATNVIRHAAYLGHAYRLVKSVDLNAWTSVVTNIAPAGGWLEFHVPATGSPCFYRVLAQ